ncbi:hypothetical protein [Treponema sp. J25]|uniref:Sec-independent protein translocase subunit TatA/TatB n=1 Tax=Treponema sp. J25 TaxID=2094121 RepID=UPI0010522EB5|nr:hypothetical protein [Treponema sp. J25]TCW61456.1 hypothetical protein C5O22_06455 [Treponema sp. J25]
MFNIGLPEVLVIFVITLIFIRPEDIPKIFRIAGKFYGQVKKYYEELTGLQKKVISEIEGEMKSFPKNKNDDKEAKER